MIFAGLIYDHNFHAERHIHAAHLNNPDLYRLQWPEEPEDPEYVGCYHDDTQDRVLTHTIAVEGMTTAVCREYCSEKNAPYYATQVGVWLVGRSWSPLPVTATAALFYGAGRDPAAERRHAASRNFSVRNTKMW